MWKFWQLETFGIAERYSNQEDLIYYLHQKSPFSFSIYKSDYFRNAIILTNLIGSLVKTDNAGKYNLYLAEKLETTLDKKTWKFTLKKNLSCESGEKITASSYAKNLTESLKRYSRSGRLLEFEKLEGAEKLDDWNTDKIPGISSDGEDLIFNFKERPEQLFERLADGYFGYICAGNFEKDNFTWKNEQTIISSGPYRVEKVNSEYDILLSYRTDVLGVNTIDFKNVRYKIVSDPSEINEKTFVAQLNHVIPKRDDVDLIQGVPTFTVNLSLPIWDQSIFQDIEARRYFFYELYKQKQKYPYSDVSTIAANSFFPLDQRDYFSEHYDKNRIPPWKFKKTKSAIVSLSTVLPIEYQKLLLKIIISIGKKMNFDVIEYNAEQHQPIGPENIKPFDIRITSVDMDAVPYFSLLDMIFCSELGVRYSDFDGHVCGFIGKYISSHKGPLSAEQREHLHELIINYGLLMPLAHRSLTYMYSRDINLTSVSASGLVLMPELLKKK